MLARRQMPHEVDVVGPGEVRRILCAANQEALVESVPKGLCLEDTYLRAVAYVLSRNGLPAGDAPLVKGATGIITVP